ncbi:MAG TPA: large conductance mechanosensitive channel protein MscL [Candidatus Aphodovivens avistercoris]|nr:large conductance mechanosensitive channel protein MscL [Candidatus Aphodovivens avistercoris]
MSLVSEFKEFINRGNVMDMAVGVIIGGAFTSIVASLTNDIINPLIKLVTGGGTEVAGLTIPVPGTDNGIDFSAFISAVINFLIVALVVFFIVKAFNQAQNIGTGLAKGLVGKVTGRDGEVVEVETVPLACPFCLEEVKEGATRCPHCAGEIEAPAVPTPKA